MYRMANLPGRIRDVVIHCFTYSYETGEGKEFGLWNVGRKGIRYEGKQESPASKESLETTSLKGSRVIHFVQPQIKTAGKKSEEDDSRIRLQQEERCPFKVFQQEYSNGPENRLEACARRSILSEDARKVQDVV